MDFFKQQDQPLFASMLWATPERRPPGGGIMIVGGHSQSVQAPLAASALLEKRDIKVSTVLPDALKPFFKAKGEQPLHFVPSTPAGSLGHDSLTQIMGLAEDCDGIWLTGDLSANQETIQMVSALIEEYGRAKIVSGAIAEQILSLQQIYDRNLYVCPPKARAMSLMDQGDPGGTAATADGLAGLKINCNLIFRDNSIVWSKAQDKVCATFLQNPRETASDLVLAAEIASQITNRVKEVWPVVVNAAWCHKISSEPPK